MDEMTAFERQISGELGQMAGPDRRIDAMAMVRTVTIPSSRWPAITRRLRGGVSPTPRGRGFTMFSAVKFIAAAAIVALFGGFLLAGILTTEQGDEMAPAAVTESPSPVTTEELLSGMVTEEVEPGVFRVVNDGVRDLTYPLGGWGYSGFMVDVTPDGSVWMSVDEGDHDLFRLGEEPVFEDPWTHLRSREVAPDGSLWAIGIGGVPDDRSGIFSFDGDGWTLRATTTGDPHALAVGPDGTVWVLATDLLRLEDDGSLTTIEAWSDVYGGDAKWLELAVTPDGDVWLVGTRGRSQEGAERLLRFDGEGWAAIPGPIPGPEGWEPGFMGRGLDVGADGALWVKASRTSVARFDDPGWTTFTEADGVKPWGVPDDVFTDLLEVAADGSLWLIGSPTEEPEDCCGVSHYDGTTWTSYLVGSLIHDFAIAPDGSVWLGANDLASPLHTYVITPEAVAAIE